MTFSDSLLVTLFMMAIVFGVLIALSLIIKIFSKVLGGLEKKTAKADGQAEKVQINAVSEATMESDEDFSAGTLKLTNVDEPTAAMIMAIVSDESGIPLSELCFKSISLVRE